jgi:arabinoxylan arabinofuranohydrolase
MNAIKPVITMILVALLSSGAVAQTERTYFKVGDASFKCNGSTNAKDSAANSFTIGESYGSVYWALSGKDISNYQSLVVRLKKVEGNTLRLIIKDRANTEYIHHVDVSKINGEQEIIVDLMSPLKSADGKKTLNLKSISRISFWNYWDDGDTIKSAKVTMDEMFLEPFGGSVSIGNPIVQTRYTTDPAPMVYGDRLYVYTGHDEDGSTYFTMNDWRLYSTADMVNWTDHGSPMNWSVYSWCKGAAWAAQAIERNGKIYWYTSSESKLYGYHVVGVVVGDSPQGPFTPGRTTSLTKQFGDIDPTVFIDNDGQAYLYYGNNCLRYGLLNEDMVSLKDGAHEITLTADGFGGVKQNNKVVGKDCYEEGPWIYRRGDTYYLVYAAGGVPEHIAYSTSASPTGPWTYRGVIMPTQGGAFTNHPGVIDFKGHSYLFYHNGALPKGGGFTRSVCVEEFKYNADGTFPQINMTGSGAQPVATLNPYIRTEAETIAWSYGVKTNQETAMGVYVDSIDNGDYIKVREVDFGTEGASSVKASLKGIGGGMMTIYADNPKSSPLATIQVAANTDWKELSASLSQHLTGKHDLYFLFSGSVANMMQFDWWQFQSGDVSAIDMVNASDVAQCEDTYTLEGIKETAPQKGLNIQGGKLFLYR